MHTYDQLKQKAKEVRDVAFRNDLADKFPGYASDLLLAIVESMEIKEPIPLPCPFCSLEVEVVFTDDGPYSGYEICHKDRKRDCGVIHTTTRHKEPLTMILLWNQRIK